ncbi:MAG: glycoside hydrolase family 99-like domain-containing protein [Leptothrix sp. (in: b-proteobacteria)]
MAPLLAWNRARLLRRRERKAVQRNAIYRQNTSGDGTAQAALTEYQAALASQQLPGPHHEAALTGAPPARTDVQLICFYLPQFHPIAENDAWWGKGFTEWRNVVRGMPRFKGHEQPQLPADLGFYDLENPATLARQIELARGAGVTGFSFYYYNFDGRRVLEKPIEAFLRRPELTIDFCITWANENWTRRWDGLNDDVLLRQTHRVEAEPALFDDLCRHFADPRYIRLGERPLFILYRPKLIPDIRGWMQRLRRHCRDHHGLDPYVMMVQGFGQADPREYDIDASVEFPPHHLVTGLKPAQDLALFDAAFCGTYYRYADLVQASLDAPIPDHDFAKCVAPGWDNEARRPGRGTGFIGATPALYETWLQQAFAHARRHPVAGDQPLVFVNAWNEWAEGAHLEPDLRHGHAYLNATRRALEA